MSPVVVLAGGTSDEREVSLRSGAAVANALRACQYEVSILDTKDGLEHILNGLPSDAVIFPALHGIGGEDGTLQALLEQRSIRFVGSGSKASALCFDKFAYSKLLAKHSYTTPSTELVTYQAFRDSPLSAMPFVLKPNDGGSSIDTHVIRNVSSVDLVSFVPVFERHESMILQELISGTEITVAVVGEKALPVIEIIPPADQEFDYENKYNGATQEICPAISVNAAMQTQAQELAVNIHTLSGCQDMSRTDMIITNAGDLYVLETNTIPGLTDQSLLPKAAAAAGMPMQDLCDRLVKRALARSMTRGTASS
jgi:D-alanine-D-alanine ligase